MRHRVALISSWYPSERHPEVGVFVREQARAIARVADVVVILPEAEDAATRGLAAVVDRVEDGQRVIRVRTRRPGVPGVALALQILGVRAVLRRLAREGAAPDVIHAHVVGAGLVALGARGRGVPVVITENLSAFPRGEVRGIDRLLARLVYSRVDLALPVSGDLARHLRALGGRALMEVVPNVVDVERFRPRPRREAPDPVRALVVAGLHERKQVGVLLEALALLAGRPGCPRIELDVGGDGPLRGRLEARASELGLAVRFHGHLGAAQVAALMRDADLFVLPSRSENLPVVLLEAMASGLPIVATRVGGVPEIVEPKTGRIVEPGDVVELADAVCDVARRLEEFDPAALHDLAAERYGAPAVARRLAAIYDRVSAEAVGPS